jgi:hypothetical protein
MKEIIKINFNDFDKKEEFYRELRMFFRKFYNNIEYSESYRIIITNGNKYITEDPQGGICYLQTSKATLLMIEEYYNTVIFKPYSKRAENILNKFLKTFKF